MAGVTRNISGGRPKIYRGTGTSAVTTLDVYTDLGNKYATGGFVQNTDEDDDLMVYISNDGTNYGGGAETGADEYITLKAYGPGSIVGQAFDLTGMQIKKIKLESAGNADYQVVVF